MKSRSGRNRPRTNPSGRSSGVLAIPSKAYGRDILVSGVIGGLISTRVSSWQGVLVTAVITEVALSAASYFFPNAWPKDVDRGLGHKTAGIGAFMAGWYLGRVAQGKKIDGD